MERLASLSNEKVKFWTSLKEKKYRDQSGLFVIEDLHLIKEAYEKGYLETLLVNEKERIPFAFPATYLVTPSIIGKLSSTVSENKYLGIAKKPKPKNLGKRMILLDQIQDPGNVGTIIRLALAFGFETVVFSGGCCDPYSPKTVRATQGALFSVNIYENQDLVSLIRKLKANKVKVYGTALKNAEELDKFVSENELALVFGNEGKGMREEIIKECDSLIKIPMNSFESLNVAVAAGIIAYHFRKND